MKKLITILLLSFVLALSLSACGGSPEEKTIGEDKLHIVTTIFPEYDWVMNILGDNPGEIEVTMLLEKGTDLHSYQPSTEDILTVSSADLFIYVGGESDKWVETLLKEDSSAEMTVINLLEVLGERAVEEEMVEGMKGEHDHEEAELDEHVWLSLKNAAFITEAIEEKIEEMDSENASIYRANSEAYIEKLNALDEEYRKAAEEAPVKTLLFGDRFPLRYLVEDYGLTYYAAFMGCSAETEASFETITFLSQKVDELSLNTVLTIDGSDKKISETIVQSTKKGDQKILSFDSMQSITKKDVGEGKTYLSIMEKNLEILKEALK